MNINEFKQNDVITRVEPDKRGDASYISARMVLVGVKYQTIVLEHEQYGAIVLDEFHWSEGWNYYPDNLVNLAKVSKSQGNSEPLSTPQGKAGDARK